MAAQAAGPWGGDIPGWILVGSADGDQGEEGAMCSFIVIKRISVSSNDDLKIKKSWQAGCSRLFIYILPINL